MEGMAVTKGLALVAEPDPDNIPFVSYLVSYIVYLSTYKRGNIIQISFT